MPFNADACKDALTAAQQKLHAAEASHKPVEWVPSFAVSVCMVQERPVIKEVVDYVQERHPVAKQVGQSLHIR